ncbi:DUF1659 domain-containing protein [Rossellomorea aquimaris]|jgi:hypothetical protein|uniref:DUF1659 domain-containing protein n=1 Tax=Rossellomorea aquimaris TaxID=189382 RepID=UPI0011E8F138|nr:DUF1659 domain-containing protein [Rossellomorea aquimaris]TYS89343.1 DUF1659 domain-containing protein [Rossellomorea aquimaris]
MATADLKSTRIRLAYNDGLDEKGNPKIAYKSYSYINALATADEMNSAALSVASLSSKGLNNIEKVETFDINE